MKSREKDKETALNDFLVMTTKSWTYDRMTAEERENMFIALRLAYISGSYESRWKQLQSVQYAFLLGIGYKPNGWREPEETPKF